MLIPVEELAVPGVAGMRDRCFTTLDYGEVILTDS